jgi:hypothetical protein
VTPDSIQVARQAPAQGGAAKTQGGAAKPGPPARSVQLWRTTNLTIHAIFLVYCLFPPGIIQYEMKLPAQHGKTHPRQASAPAWSSTLRFLAVTAAKAESLLVISRATIFREGGLPVFLWTRVPERRKPLLPDICMRGCVREGST